MFDLSNIYRYSILLHCPPIYCYQWGWELCTYVCASVQLSFLLCINLMIDLCFLHLLFHNSTQILLLRSHKQKNPKKLEYSIPQRRGKPISVELHHKETGSSQRPLRKRSSPQHPTPGRRCLRRKAKVSHPPSRLCRQQFHQCSADVSISSLLSDPHIVPNSRGLEGLTRGSETGHWPENLMC